MTKHYSQLDLLRFVYGETTAHESEDIIILLDTDDDFHKSYRHLLTLKEEVNRTEKTPSTKLIERILLYSRNSPFLYPV